ncbi:MAG: thiamine pyrophosphate-dependent enzyme [Bacteroidota bacterium]
MERVYLKEERLPFCKGCSHNTISENTDRALQKLGIPLLDVILVTDIGCHGIIDKSFKTHTVHGLHGRSVALATGISAGLNHPDKKVIVFIGDGGVTIGIQHLINAAHRNYNMTVVIHNNMLYGMTGGQPSEFTPYGFKTPTLPEGAGEKASDICAIVASAGASYVERVIGIGDISGQLANAFAKSGFSLVEVMEICPSYGVKSNPGMKLSKVVDEAGLSVKIYADRNLRGPVPEPVKEVKSLIDSHLQIPVINCHSLGTTVRIMIAGSAGEGVQSAAEKFALAAISSGLNSTKKGSYPVTVGIGFSAADIIISPDKILYTGSPVPDILIITSEDGLAYARTALGNMQKGLVFIDESLPVPDTKATLIRQPFRETAGSRNAALFSLLYMLKETGFFPAEGLEAQVAARLKAQGSRLK